jgi:mycothiol synthase
MSRPYAHGDLSAVVALYNAVSQELYGTDEMSESELRTWTTTPGVVPERDLRVVDAPNGPGLMGYSDVYDQNLWQTRYWAELVVHPHAGPAVAADLLDWAEQRARSDAKPGAFLRSFTSERNAVVKDTLEQAGFTLIRHFLKMEVELDGSERRPEWPEGVRVRPMEPADERTIWAVNEECFADHWEHVEEPFEEWQHWTTSRDDFDPSLWLLALAGDEVAGYSLCRVHDVDPGLGWVQNLGVRRPWRRRGLARALLEHSFEVFRRRGIMRVGLGVDAESLTGATKLYEAAGMRAVKVTHTYEKALA